MKNEYQKIRENQFLEEDSKANYDLDGVSFDGEDLTLGSQPTPVKQSLSWMERFVQLFKHKKNN